MMFCSVKKKRTNINVTLIELLFGIGVYAAAGVILIMLLMQDKGRSLAAFLIGATVSAGMVIHMYAELEKALFMDEMGALKHTRMTTCFRMVTVAVILAAVGITKGDVISAVVGVMALKVSAYIQPFTHKFFNKIKGKGR